MIAKYGTDVFLERSRASGGGPAPRKPAAGEDATNRSATTAVTVVNVVTESKGQRPAMKKVRRLFIHGRDDRIRAFSLWWCSSKTHFLGLFNLEPLSNCSVPGHFAVITLQAPLVPFTIHTCGYVLVHFLVPFHTQHSDARVVWLRDRPAGGGNASLVCQLS